MNRYRNSACFCALPLFLAWSMMGGPVAEADDHWDYPPEVSLEEVQERLQAVEPVRPRLLATPEQWNRIRASLEDDPLLQEVAEGIIAQAIQMEEAPPITRTIQGRRLLSESRRALKRLTTLATAYQLTGDDRHVERARQEMLAVADFRDWNPSHYLDVAEMTMAMAIGYDWLYDQLDESTRQVIREAIVEKGVALPFETRHRGWVRARNNWGQVCHAGMTAGALAVMEQHPELAARTVQSAVQNVTAAMAVYAPRGSYPEGPGYWSYGTNFNVLLIGVLESVLGTDFGLTQAPGFEETGAYLSLATGPSGLFFNYADGGSGRRVNPALFWLARRYERPDWLLGEASRLRDALARRSPRDVASGADRLLALTLLWIEDGDTAPEIRMPLHWHSGGSIPVTVHRSSWTDPNATYVGFKAGSPAGPHGHMDIGSFVLDADGVRWAVDLGAEGYHRIESRGMNLWNRAQDSDRWRIFRQNNHSHNTLVIDGQLQQAAAHAPIDRFSDDPEFPHSIADMSRVYAGQVESADRGVALLPSREVLFQDELRGLEPGSRVRWGMVTRSEPQETGRPQIELREGSARLYLQILAPGDLVWKTVDTATPREEWDSPNPGTVMVAFEAIAPDSGELTLSVLATPGSCETSLRETLELRPLDDWPTNGSR